MPAVEIIRNQSIANFVIQNEDVVHGKVLDVGCGTQPYRNLFPGTEWVGLDIRPIADVTADMSDMPFDDESFDTVFCIDSLNFCPDPLKVMAELVRVCKPGGVILIVARTTAEDDSIFVGVHSTWLQTVLNQMGCQLVDTQEHRAQAVSGLFSRAEADNFWTNQTWLEGVNNSDLERFTQYLDGRYPAIAGVVVRREGGIT